MTNAMEKNNLSQAEFARLHGVSKKTVTMWKQAGRLVLGAGGLVDVERSNELLGQRPEKRKGGSAKGPTAKRTGEAQDAPDWPLHEASRRKEAAMARLKELEYDRKTGRVVLVEDVIWQINREMHIVRTRLLAIPSQCAVQIARLTTPVEVEVALRDVIYEAMSELSNGAHMAAEAGGKVESA